MSATTERQLRRCSSYASLSVAVLLVIAKASAWFVTDSLSLLASLVDAVVDVTAALVTVLGVHYAARPADAMHRFGHGKAESVLAANAFKEALLPGFGVQSLQTVQGTDQAPLGQPLEVQEEVQVSTLEPSRHVVKAPVVQAVGVHQAEDFLAIGSQEVGQLDFGGQLVEHQERTVQFNLFDLDVGHGGGQDGATIALLAHIADEPLHDLVSNPAAFDLGEIGFVALYDLSYKAHVVATYNHYG